MRIKKVVITELATKANSQSSTAVKAIFKLQEVRSAHREYASSKGMGSIIMEVNP